MEVLWICVFLCFRLIDRWIDAISNRKISGCDVDGRSWCWVFRSDISITSMVRGAGS